MLFLVEMYQNYIFGRSDRWCFVTGSFRAFLCNCSPADYSQLNADSLHFCPRHSRMSVFSYCTIMFRISFRSDWQLVFWSMAVRAPVHSWLVRHAESLATQEAGVGGREQECEHVGIQAQNPTRSTNSDVKICHHSVSARKAELALVEFQDFTCYWHQITLMRG